MTKDTSSAATWLQLISPCHLDTSIPRNSTLLMAEPSGIWYTPFTFFHALGFAVEADCPEVLPVPEAVPVLPAELCPGPTGDMTVADWVSPGPTARDVPAGTIVPAPMSPARASAWQRLIICVVFFIVFSSYLCIFQKRGDVQPSAVTSPLIKPLSINLVRLSVLVQAQLMSRMGCYWNCRWSGRLNCFRSRPVCRC